MDDSDFFVESNAQQVVNVNQQSSPYSVTPIPGHEHNGIDANKIPVGNLIGYYTQIITYSPIATATQIINLANSSINHVQMPAGNITLAVSSPRAGQCFIVRIKQDGTGSRTVTWFGGISWPNNTVPTLSTAGNHWDSFGFETTSSTTGKVTFDGFVIGQNLQ